ncbi:MAG: hypothetical protein CM1200mP21_10020 [Candidatus Poseidoniales archaeon]|nr:MAG: hypothetical protein CM1200mP21_10020 [Candidatus Poseidoniales archaeon]
MLRLTENYSPSIWWNHGTGCDSSTWLSPRRVSDVAIVAVGPFSLSMWMQGFIGWGIILGRRPALKSFFALSSPNPFPHPRTGSWGRRQSACTASVQGGEEKRSESRGGCSHLSHRWPSNHADFDHYIVAFLATLLRYRSTALLRIEAGFGVFSIHPHRNLGTFG